MSEQKSLPRLLAGDRLGRYAIRRLLGRSKNAEVYQAFHPDFKRDVESQTGASVTVVQPGGTIEI